MGAKARRLVAIERVPVFKQVVDAIAGYIDDNDMQPGARLPSDREFVSELGVSRPLVQQALKVLEGLGRIKIVHGQGTFIADDRVKVMAQELTRGVRDQDQLAQQILEARALVDGELIRTAFERDRNGLLEELQRVLDERTEELAREGSESGGDLSFEAVFGEFCQNDILRRMQLTLHNAWMQTRIDQDPPVADQLAIHEEHAAMLEALRGSDVDGALDLYMKHIQSWV